jgi:hypothetical protein
MRSSSALAFLGAAACFAACSSGSSAVTPTPPGDDAGDDAGDAGQPVPPPDASPSDASDAGGDAGLGRPPASCSGDGFCWASPSWPAAHLTAAWGSGRDDVWAVGQAGAVLHWDGVTWSFVDAGVTDDLTAVWGTSPYEVWVAGGPSARRWDGKAWTSIDSGLAALPSFGGIDGLWGTAPNDIWGIANVPGSVILHYDGQAWKDTFHTIPQNGGITQVWGQAADDVWVVGRGNVVHYDGTAWTQQIPSLGAGWVNGVYATRTTDAWFTNTIGVFHWSGAMSTGYPSTPGGGLFGFGASDVLAFGATQLVRWNGSSWSNAPAAPDTIDAVWGDTDTRLWAFGTGIVGRYDGAAWSPPLAQDMRGIYAAAANDVWAVQGTGPLLHWDGAKWATPAMAPAGELVAIDGTSPSDVWTVGAAGAAWHFDGSSWTKAVTGTAARLVNVQARTSSDVLAVGDDGTFARWDGHAWKAAPTQATKLDAVWAASATDVWLVGAKGLSGIVLQGDGTSWTPVDVGASNSSEFVDVSGTSASDVWIALGGGVLHFDGATWTHDPLLHPELSRVRAFAPDDAWGTTIFGDLLHWDGHAWSPVSTRTRLVTGVAGSAHDVWAFGSRGTLLRRTK